MPETVAGRYGLLAAYVTIAVVLSVRTYRAVRRRGWARLLGSPTRHVGAATLLVAAVVCSVLKPAPVWAPMLTMVCFTYGLLLVYAITVDVLENRSLRLRSTPLTWWVTALLAITLVFDVLRGDNRGNFVDGEPYTPTVTYFVANMVAISPMVVLEWSLAWAYGRSVCRDHALTSVVASTYTLRRATGWLAFSLGTVGLLVFELTLVLTMVGVRSPLLDRVFLFWQSVIPPLAGGLFLISVALRWPYTLLAHAIQWFTTHRRRHDYATLVYLQQQMRTVVPTVPHVELADPQLQWDRALTEIADAREVLWSSERRDTPITPDEEAGRIFHWLHHPRDRAAGPYLHPPVNDATIVAHNLAVARALQRLEQEHANAARERSV